MDEQTITALKGSIAKWEAIVDGTGEDDGPENCPLCQLFHGKPNYCKGCPVQERTGMHSCMDTPYERYATDSETDETAQEELDFLKSLLPENPPAPTEWAGES